ncbi:hypothetical protein Ancab_001076 [Ancistrocladus abbreviatus]
MSLSLGAHCNSFGLSSRPHFLVFDGEYAAATSIRKAPEPFRLIHPNNKLSYAYNRNPPLHAVSGDGNVEGKSAGQNSPENLEGSGEFKESQQGWSLTSTEILKQLRRYGISGILSYGLLNTAYYLTTFLLVWFYFAPAPGRMGYFAAVERFLKVMAMVWAGSQVTKLIRAGGALALAPFVDRGLSWFTVRFNFESRGKAFLAIAGCCLGVAVLLFLAVTLLWA